MSWSRRAALHAGLLGATALLAGCFRPMLAETGDAAGLRGRIALPAVTDRTGFAVNRVLERRLGRPERPDLRLFVDLDLVTRGLAITRDSAVTRRTVTATARWRLAASGAEAPILAAVERAESGFNETADLFATRAARLDVEERLARDVAESIARSILARADTVAAAAPAS